MERVGIDPDVAIEKALQDGEIHGQRIAMQALRFGGDGGEHSGRARVDAMHRVAAFYFAYFWISPPRRLER
ncbi:MAG TPA: hypothetical protein VFQ20_02760 [Burkholderiaceae bacterium]|nr:hypothetical protein [Burkholderiaceae bacterium]